MLCFRDKTFCGYWKKCGRGGTCQKALTSTVLAASECTGLPICEFAEHPECFVGKRTRGK